MKFPRRRPDQDYFVLSSRTPSLAETVLKLCVGFLVEHVPPSAVDRQTVSPPGECNYNVSRISD